jgi:hypothetical protein
MSPSQVIGLILNEASAITNIVSTRIFNGFKPGSTTVPATFPAINYFEMAGGKKIYGFYAQTYSINCRAATAETALNLARKVDDLFSGTSGTGIYGCASNVSAFEITRATTRQMQGLIPEPDEGLYNAPVDIQIFFPASSIS